jgi:hypothetical protein
MTVAVATAGAGSRTVGLVTVASGVVGALGIVFLGGMFTAFAAGAQQLGERLGWINDVLVLLSYALLMPSVLATRGRLLRSSPRLANATTVIGLATLAAVTVSQAMLVTGVITFEQQLPSFSLFLVALGAYFVPVGWAGKRSGALRVGPWTGLAATLYLGVPVWAIRLGRQLLDEAGRG